MSERATPRRLAGKWASYIGTVVRPDDATASQIDGCRCAFYAGVVALFNILRDCRGGPGDADRVVGEVDDEIQAFIVEIQSRAAAVKDGER